MEDSVLGPAGAGPRGGAASVPVPSPSAAKPEGIGQPRQPRSPEVEDREGPRRRARPFAQPHGWDGPRGREQGGEKGVLAPAPPLSLPGTNSGQPLPQRLPPRPAGRDPWRQSHWKKPRPQACYLQTLNPPRAAASRCRLLRMRDGARSACAFAGP